MRELARFLVAAKGATYAQGMDAVLLDDGTKELTYTSGEWRYRDRYIGFDPFAGQEIVWRLERPVWAMNYFGETLLPTAEHVLTAAEVYAFLRQALHSVTVSRPYRGPARFAVGAFTYRNESQGELDDFTGFETISHDGVEVYELAYHGGILG